MDAWNSSNMALKIGLFFFNEIDLSRFDWLRTPIFGSCRIQRGSQHLNIAWYPFSSGLKFNGWVDFNPWLVVWNIFYFPFHIWDVILPIDELIFFRGVGQPPTRSNMSNSYWFHPSSLMLPFSRYKMTSKKSPMSNSSRSILHGYKLILTSLLVSMEISISTGWGPQDS